MSVTSGEGGGKEKKSFNAQFLSSTNERRSRNEWARLQCAMDSAAQEHREWEIISGI